MNIIYSYVKIENTIISDIQNTFKADTEYNGKEFRENARLCHSTVPTLHIYVYVLKFTYFSIKYQVDDKLCNMRWCFGLLPSSVSQHKTQSPLCPKWQMNLVNKKAEQALLHVMISWHIFIRDFIM